MRSVFCFSSNSKHTEQLRELSGRKELAVLAAGLSQG